MEVIHVENETKQDLRNIQVGFYSPLLVFKKNFYLRSVAFTSKISGTINLMVSVVDFTKKRWWLAEKCSFT